MSERKLSSSAEDYLEAIYLLAREKGKVRTTSIASFLGHKPSSVTEMLRKLSDDGLVKHEKYSTVIFTPRGEEIARRVFNRHKDLANFLQLLGADKESAEINACKIGHVVDPETMEKLRRFLKFVEEAPVKPIWLKHYKHFIKTGEYLKCEFREEK